MFILHRLCFWFHGPKSKSGEKTYTNCSSSMEHKMNSTYITLNLFVKFGESLRNISLVRRQQVTNRAAASRHTAEKSGASRFVEDDGHLHQDWFGCLWPIKIFKIWSQKSFKTMIAAMKDEENLVTKKERSLTNCLHWNSMDGCSNLGEALSWCPF